MLAWRFVRWSGLFGRDDQAAYELFVSFASLAWVVAVLSNNLFFDESIAMPTIVGTISMVVGLATGSGDQSKAGARSGRASSEGVG